MGVKVKVVKDHKTQKEVTVRDCENGYEGEYQCKTHNCEALMSFVPKHEQRRLGKVVQVSSFFKLKKGEIHAYGVCPYNTLGSVEIIAKDSDKNILKSIGENKYEFSLQVLHKPESNKETSPANDLDNNQNKTPSRTKKYIRKGTSSSYIKTLNQILTLRSQIDDNNELSQLVTLDYRGKKIKWNKFFFEVESYDAAYSIVERHKANYPMCFQGIISKSIPSNDSFRYEKLKVYSPYIELVDDVTPIPSLELIIADKNLDPKEFPEGTHVLAYGSIHIGSGMWVPPEEKESIQPKKIMFHNMSIWINHTAQVRKILP